MKKIAGLLLALAIAIATMLVGVQSASAGSIGGQVYVWEPNPGSHTCFTTYYYLPASAINIVNDGVGNRLAWEHNGNLVRYHNNVAQWYTATSGKNPYKLAFQDDGNIVIYTSGGTPLWSSGTFYGCNGYTYQANILAQPSPHWEVDHYDGSNWVAATIG